jgi:phage gp29-like protein
MADTLPPDLTGEIATTRDGRDITRPWVRHLEEAPDPRLQRSVDWGVYDRVLLDDQVKSCLEQRIRAVVSRDWDVLSGDEEDARANAAAEAMSDQLQRVGWDRVTEKMLSAVFNGYSVAELSWGASAGAIGWVQAGRMRPIHVRHARRFRWDVDGKLRLLTRANMATGELLPDRKFWTVTSGAGDDDAIYGRGLAEWLYWPTLFKRNGVRFWNIFLDKFSVPTAKGTYPRGTSAADQDKLLAATQAIATDSGIVVPEGMMIELLQLAGQGADFAGVCRYMDAAIAKIILSQTMTTDQGSSHAQSKTHEGVKLEVVKADADLLSDSFNAGPARWWTDLNFGPDVPSPIVKRVVEEEDDLKAAADTDAVLSTLGWRRTAEGFRARFGDDYEPAPLPSAGQQPPPGQGEAKPDPEFSRLVDKPVVTALAEALGPVLRPRDVVDEAVDAAMADDGWQAAVLAPLAAQLAEASSPEDVALICAAAAAGSDEALTEPLARAGFALRFDALTDDEGEGA